ncbi:uncharacterized protein LOC113305328 [Papaver somniferum]|uniref:uncharacterized protein LOC113305328 n=1 Tax=Papaver somniferum TaxID=3469 RepID=UPI000E701E00|nr:uncharacterized protein LOC113305328 [Papaver somniferum]
MFAATNLAKSLGEVFKMDVMYVRTDSAAKEDMELNHGVKTALQSCFNRNLTFLVTKPRALKERKVGTILEELENLSLDIQGLKFVKLSDYPSNNKLVGAYKLIPLGKGFLTIKLDNEVDRNYIKAGQCEVNYQVLRLRNRVSNFRPANARTSEAQVWIRFPGLGLEFWKENILFEICNEIGTPIKIDVATAKCEIGYYANVLVEVDFAQPIPSKIWINTKFGGFFQEVLIHECPKFCSTCKIVGHLVTECYMERNKNKTPAANVNTHKSSSQGINPSLQVTPTVNDIPFDICNPDAREEEGFVVKSIDATNTLTSNRENISINPRRFESIANKRSEQREKAVIHGSFKNYGSSRAEFFAKYCYQIC